MSQVLFIRINHLTSQVEMPTPGWGPRHPPGTPPRGGVWGRGIEHSKPRGTGTGDFFENPPGFWRAVYWYDVWQ